MGEPAALSPPLRRFVRPLPGRPELSFVDLAAFGDACDIDVGRLPRSLCILLESLIRKSEHSPLAWPDLLAIARRQGRASRSAEVPFFPSRVVLQDAAGIPLLADLAAMRTEAARRGVDVSLVEPRLPVDMVIDHSVSVDEHTGADPAAANMRIEFRRNDERYRFLKWADQAFAQLRVVPPGVGILHQVNLEFLSPGVHVEAGLVFPDSVIGTDSHTVMINGIGVLGWGVGGIEAIAALLGESTSVPLREIVAVSLTGALAPGVSATDLVLHVTERLRREDLVGCFVEFVGPAARGLSAYDRSTVANMAPEYGATTAYFGVDEQTLDYLRQTGREPAAIELVRDYWTAQRMFGIGDATDADFDRTLVIDLAEVRASVAGPRRPHDRVDLGDIGKSFRAAFGGAAKGVGATTLASGDIVLAAITSCTNTANPRLMIAAALLARNALARGLRLPAHVKATLAPGSRVVASYLQRAGLLEPLERLGFRLVAHGCTTCVGNSGELVPTAADALAGSTPPVVAAVLSGNRNFDGRVHPQVRANYLMSPALVVALGLAGTVNIDPDHEPIGNDGEQRPVFLRDLWPDAGEIDRTLASALDPADYRLAYDDVSAAVPAWSALRGESGPVFSWQPDSLYFREPPFLARRRDRPFDARLRGRALLSLGDSITTDHISPVGRIAAGSTAASHLRSHGVGASDFNTYGARRCNHDVMVRGTFANPRLVNRLLGCIEGPFARRSDGEVAPLYEVAMDNLAQGHANIVFAGLHYGSGSARDWAAKGTALLGVACVVALGFERIHRANLIGLGVLPLQITVPIADEAIAASASVDIEVDRAAGTASVRLLDAAGGTLHSAPARALVASDAEWAYMDAGGLLPHVFAKLLASVPS